MRESLLYLLGFLLIGVFGFTPAVTNNAQSGDSITQVCDVPDIRLRPATFSPGGIILTYFDRDSLWVYNIDQDTRYPLPETAPCGTNCHLSRDARWITYLDTIENRFGKMRLDGTQRTPLADYATEIEWWDENTLLVWTLGSGAYLQMEGSEDISSFTASGIVNIQPGGTLATRVILEGDDFSRWLVDLNEETTSRPPLRLGLDLTYFNATAWSPDGEWLAFVGPGDFNPLSQIRGGEIYAVRPQDMAPMRRTWLSDVYGAVRINGHASGELSWSPDGTQLAFWVAELNGPAPETAGPATIHVLDITSGQITAYCGFSTSTHTPNPPRLVWSPDSTHIAFGANVPQDDKGYLLLALTLENGQLTELSHGIYPAFGTADVVAWGLPPQ